MKAIPILLVVIVSILFLGGCKKTELTGEYAEYVGGWSSNNGTKIEFRPNGKADYEERGNDFGDSLDNARVIIEGNSLKLKKGVITKNFTINMPPTEQSNNQWEMRLNNRLYKRN